MSLNSRPARLYVANRRANPIVRMSGSSAVSSSARTAGRLAVAGELVAQPPPGELGELALLAEVGVPQVPRRDPLEALPEAALLGGRHRARRGRRRGGLRAGPRSARRPTSGPWTPLVRPMISWSVMPCQVVLAVSPCSWLTAFAPFVSRSENAVMSNWSAVLVHADALGEDVVDGQPRRCQHRPRDAPDEVRIEALVAGRDRGVDREHAVAPDLGPGLLLGRAGRQVLAGPLGEQERRVALVEVPDRRRQAEGPDRAHAADAEDQLLVQAHLAAADVQDVGDRAVRDGVLRRRRCRAAGPARVRPGRARPRRPGRGRAAPTDTVSGRPLAPWTRLIGSRLRS